MSRLLERFFREEHGRLMGVLVRRFGDFELAEDALQEALASAIQNADQWTDGLPGHFFSWVLLTAKRKAIDILRREAVGRYKTAQLATKQMTFLSDEHIIENSDDCIRDERLGLLFTCCHPALSEKARIALTLKCVAGFKIGELSRALLMKATSVSQTLTRAKQKIREAGIPFAAYETTAIPERLESVLSVLYLIFNEGYSAAENEDHIRKDLCEEAVTLTRLLSQLHPGSPEVLGLLALMLYHHARRASRVGLNGQMIMLEDQDAGLFDKNAIAEATSHLKESFHITIGGYYQIQAHIAALHARVFENEINWPKIVFLYECLVHESDSAVVRLNYAAALLKIGQLAEARSVLFAAPLAQSLRDYPYYHIACATILAKENRRSEAQKHYRMALNLTKNKREIGHLRALIDNREDHLN